MLKRPDFILSVLFLFSSILFSCTSSQRGLFTRRTPHERYQDKLVNAGLRQTALGTQWFAAADNSLRSPLGIALPYQETGYFAAERPEAAGFVFACRRGEKLTVTLTQKPSGFRMFIDLWQYNQDSSRRYLQSADSVDNGLAQEIEKDGNYLLRLQPELLGSGEYTLSVTTVPSLAFPVPAGARPRVGSVWGDDRDRGVRRHEGIDIFAPLRTAAVAAANGQVTRVTENKLGGKVVFMRPAGRDYVLYYAHLDTQLAYDGQQVKAGDTLGLIGNTGNARTTPPHLHFGIYTNGGAINPLPFVEAARQWPGKITASIEALNRYAHNNRSAAIYTAASRSAASRTLPPFTLLRVHAATANWYKVSTADGGFGFISSDNVSVASYRRLALQPGKPVYDMPDTTAPIKRRLAAGTTAPVYGAFNKFYFVKTDDTEGWVQP